MIRTLKILLLILIPGYGSAQTDPVFEKTLLKLSTERVMKTVERLASPGYDGRMPGSRGYLKAAAYCRKFFRKSDLKPAFGNSFYQYVAVETNRFVHTPSLSLHFPDGKITRLMHGTDFVCRGFSGSGQFTLPLIFCGYGIESVSGKYNDYCMIRDTGYIAVVFKHNPPWTMEGENYGNMLTRYKANKARAHGARAVIFIPSFLSENPQKPIGSIMDGPGVNDPAFPQFQISRATAYSLFAPHSIDPVALQRKMDSTRLPHSVHLRASAYVRVETVYDSAADSPNIAAIVEGSDPTMKNEFIVVGAHLDHVGRQGKKLYFPGANDNASGSAAVLALAKLFSDPALRPKRSICFILYTSEEQGLLGSEYFAARFGPAPAQIVAALNLDCIGHGDSIQIGCGKSYPFLWELAKKTDEQHARLMVRDTWQGGGADAEAFHKRGIPCMYFVSKYSYTHLHLPDDVPQTINTETYREIIHLAARVIRRLSTDVLILTP